MTEVGHNDKGTRHNDKVVNIFDMQDYRLLRTSPCNDIDKETKRSMKNKEVKNPKRDSKLCVRKTTATILRYFVAQHWIGSLHSFQLELECLG